MKRGRRRDPTWEGQGVMEVEGARPRMRLFSVLGGGATMPSFSSFNPEPAQPGDVHKDYESLTMMRMRQAAERKRLAEQMMAEEDAA